jgi:RNA polymerase sigma-70 factor (ECF subfamily)
MIQSSDLGEMLSRVFQPVQEELPIVFRELLDRLEALSPLPPKPGRLSDRELRREMETALPDLRAFSRSLTRNGETADDLVQETMMKAWAARERFEPGTSFRAWTFTIARNLFFSQMRRRKFTGDWDETLAARILAAPPSQEHRLHLRDLEAGLATLSANQREALLLVALGQMDYETAADTLGVAVGTIKSRVSRAREALAAHLEGQRPGALPVIDVTHRSRNAARPEI